MMLLISDPFFCDPQKNLNLPVIELTLGDISNGKTLSKNYFYLVDDTIYEYVGNVMIRDIVPGTIFKIGTKHYIEPHEKDMEEFYNVKFIVSEKDYNERLNTNGTLEELMASYMTNYKNKNNLIKSGNIKIVPSGDVYMPDLSPDDDPLERIIKLMLRHMKLVLNDYRGQFDKKHGLDNIKSALNGATRNMSIVKFLSWCKNFDLDWEIVFDNINSDAPAPIKLPIVLSSYNPYPWMDIPTETRDCFTVPLRDNEDPLKRGIKLALGEKQIDLKDYKSKSPTPHLINNMKSALKSSQKMTLPYCINWCEIIDLSYSFKVINRKDGIWYKIIGFDVTTNDREME